MSKRIFSMIACTLACTLIVCTMMTVPVWASDADGAERIIYANAVRGAVRNLPMIAEFDDHIETIREAREDLQSLLELRRAAGTLTREERDLMQREIANLGANINTMRATQEMLRTGTEAAMRGSMTNINNSVLDIKLMEASLEHERTNLNNARLRFGAGLISESDLHTQDLLVSQIEANLAGMQVSLETERQELNRILQRPVTGNFYVYFERELIELPENLDAHVRHVAPRQPNVRQADIALNRAQAYFSDVHIDFASPERAERERARNQRQRERNELLRNVETAMRNHYNTLTMLKHNMDSLEIDLLRATERLEAVTLNHQAGLATQFDIEAAALAVLRYEIRIEQNLNTFWNAQFAFENPFLLTMGS